MLCEEGGKWLAFGSKWGHVWIFFLVVNRRQKTYDEGFPQDVGFMNGFWIWGFEQVHELFLIMRTMKKYTLVDVGQKRFEEKVIN